MKKTQTLLSGLLIIYSVTAYGAPSLTELVNDSKNVIIFREVEIFKRPTILVEAVEAWRQEDKIIKSYGLRFKTIGVKESTSSGVSFLSGITGFSFGSSETREEQFTFLNEDEAYLLIAQIDRAHKLWEGAKNQKEKTVARLPVNQNLNLIIKLGGTSFSAGFVCGGISYEFRYDYELTSFAKNIKIGFEKLKDISSEDLKAIQSK